MEEEYIVSIEMMDKEWTNFMDHVQVEASNTPLVEDGFGKSSRLVHRRKIADDILKTRFGVEDNNWYDPNIDFKTEGNFLAFKLAFCN